MYRKRTIVVAGSMLETYVYTEILKSWWSAAREPSLFHYRTTKGREVDFVFVQDGMLYPVEVKRSAAVKTDWVRNFSALDRLGTRGPGAVVCLTDHPLPIDAQNMAIPVGHIG